MAEYITKNAAINAAENAPIELFQSEWEEIEEAINAAPAADVVPVVRCKDCAHLFYTMCAACGFLPRNPNDFCSYGVIKDGGESNV
jgi:hypothetical protein|nr:MAG TPA: zinc-ribbon protein [Caudoviricetes sp.]